MPATSNLTTFDEDLKMKRFFVRPVVGFEKNYIISNSGEIYSIPRKGNWVLKKIKPRLNHNGYERVALSKDGKKYHFFVHRLVAYTYMDNPENKRTINHIDGCKTNNNFENLEWATHSENNQHAVDNKLGNRAVGQDMSKKLKNEDVLEILRLRNNGMYHKDIAKIFNVTSKCVGDILLGKRWNHLTKIKPL